MDFNTKHLITSILLLGISIFLLINSFNMKINPGFFHEISITVTILGVIINLTYFVSVVTRW